MAKVNFTVSLKPAKCGLWLWLCQPFIMVIRVGVRELGTGTNVYLLFFEHCSKLFPKCYPILFNDFTEYGTRKK